MRRDLSLVPALCLALALPLLASCQGGTSSGSYTLGPSATRVAAKETLKLSALANGSPANGVWYVNGKRWGAADVGTIDGAGTYSAPQVPAVQKVTLGVGGEGSTAPSATTEVTVLPAGVVEKTKNAQVASYTFTTDGDASVAIEFGETTLYGKSTWGKKAPLGGGKTTVLVAGMKQDTTYHLRAVATYPDGTVVKDADQTFTTGRSVAEAARPRITVTRDPGQIPQPGIEILDLSGFSAAANVMATDLDGNILWAYDAGLPMVSPNPVKQRANGNFLINYGVANATAIDGLMSMLREVDLAGNEIWSMDGPALNKELAAATCKGCNITIVGTHHDFVELPNGHIVVIGSQKQTKTVQGSPAPVEMVGDVLIDLDESHKPVWVWSAFDHPEALDINRHPMGIPDWLHSNALLYSPTDGALLFSIRHQHWILRIDYADGKGDGSIKWRLGYQGDFKLLNGTDPEDWFYAQHGPSFVGSASAGKFDLVVFDNGDYRVLDDHGTTCRKRGPCSSRVTIWSLDEAAKTATIKWTVAPQLFAFFGGNAEVLANGHVEYDDATLPGKPAAGVFEVTQDKVPIPVWGMQIGGQYAYRAFRLPSLYPGVRW